MSSSSAARIPKWHMFAGLFRYIGRLAIFDALMWMLITGLPALPGLIVREFFDTLTGAGHLGWSAYAVLALWMAWVVARLMALFAGRVSKSQLRFTVSGLLRYNLLDLIYTRPGAEPLRDRHGENLSTGEVLSTFREDAEQLENQMAFFGEFAGTASFGIWSLIILLSINAQLTLFVFLPLILVTLVVRGLQARIRRAREASREATQRVTGLIGEMFGAVQAIQVASAERHIIRHFRSVNDSRGRQMVRDEVLYTLLGAIWYNFSTIGTGLILIAVGAQGDMTLSVGDFALFMYFLSFQARLLTDVGLLLTNSRQSEIALERMHRLAPDAPPEAVTAPAPLYLNTLTWHKREIPPVPQPVRTEADRLETLEVRNLTYLYPTTGRGIENLSFSIRRGQVVVITGRIGSGKTTLLRAVQGLLPAQSGEIFWNNRQITELAAWFVPPHSAYTPQIPILFSTTLDANIGMGLDADREAVMRAARQAVFDGDLAHMPNAFETQVGNRGVRLSGGQMQRAAAARMFVRQPDLLIFDDLSSALDVVTEQTLWERLFTGKDGWKPACLVVSHRRAVLRRADLVIEL